MRKQIFGRQLQRDANERKALFKSLMESLILEERITTTEAKAKAIKGSIERLVTKARKGAVAERLLQPYFHMNAVKKLVTDIAPRFVNRPGGYTRIVKIGNRTHDNAKIVMMEWVEKTKKIATVVKAPQQEIKTKMEKEKKEEKKIKVAVKTKKSEVKKAKEEKKKDGNKKSGKK
jgi:large subunit ribosomal protein L17